MRQISPLLLVLMLTLAVFGQGDVPAHHTAPPAKGAKTPPILPAPERWGPNFSHPVQVKAYEVAEKIPNVLYQQPCYCRCDRSAGHTSLHSCFSTDHGAHCATCMQELYYSYKMTKAKKTPAQIREGILHGDYNSIDLQKVMDIN